jgi:hypothetical protein
MQTSEKLFVLSVGLSGLLAAMSVHCVASDECDQYSDCAQGFTCAAGRCVLPPPPADAATDAPRDTAADRLVDSPSDAAHEGGTDAHDDATDASHDDATDARDGDSEADGTPGDADKHDHDAGDHE